MEADAEPPEVPPGRQPPPSGERPSAEPPSAEPPSAEPPSADHVAVSVVIPTYNSSDLLREALDALARQTLPADQIEIIVVDDGSTDDTWDRLTVLARERSNLRIVRQEPSGRPSVGRNRGLAMARGRYVFFLDADDYLSEDALRRMVGFADQYDCDVVIGRVTAVGAPGPPRHPGDNVIDADILRDGVWKSLAPAKLFRRALIDRIGITFPEDQVQGEDQVFVATCLFAARRISVLRDGDYYFRRVREDGQNISRQPQSLVNKRLTTTRMASLIINNTSPGERREALLTRILLNTLGPALSRPFEAADSGERDEFLAAVQREVLPYLSDATLARAKLTVRLRLLAARDGGAAQLSELNERIDRGLRYRVESDSEIAGADGRQLCCDLGSDLNALIPPSMRRVDGLLTLAHRTTRLGSARCAVLVDVGLDDERIQLDHVALVAVARRHRRAEVLLDRRIAAANMRLTIEPAALTAAVAASTVSAPKEWHLLLRSYQHDTLVAVTDLTWPEDQDPHTVVESRPARLRASTVATVAAGEDGRVVVRSRQLPARSTTWRRTLRRRLRGLRKRLHTASRVISGSRADDQKVDGQKPDGPRQIDAGQMETGQTEAGRTDGPAGRRVGGGPER